MIYLDNAATTKPLPCAINTFNSVASELWGNPNSAHDFGQNASAFLFSQKVELAVLIGCEPNEIYFTSGATEACNWAICTLNHYCATVIADGSEHHAVLDAMRKYEEENRRGEDRLYEYGFASMFANNETGEIAKWNGVGNGLLFSDATASMGHVPFSFREHNEIDYLAFGAHKFGGFTGIGALVVKRGSPLYPFIVGGGQQRNLRAGTEPLPLIASMVEALRYRYEHMEEYVLKCIRLRDMLIQRLLPLDGAHLNGKWTQGACHDRLPNNVNISFRGVEGSSLVNALSKQGIMVSSGSACNSKENKPSHVLKARGYDDDIAMGSIRMTLSGEESIEDINYVAETIKETLKNF